MAKRQQKSADVKFFEKISQNRATLQKFLWGFVVVVSVIYGLTNGYPIAAAGEMGRGILTGLGYGLAAFIVITVSFFLNQKLKGR